MDIDLVSDMSTEVSIHEFWDCSFFDSENYHAIYFQKCWISGYIGLYICLYRNLQVTCLCMKLGLVFWKKNIFRYDSFREWSTRNILIYKRLKPNILVEWLILLLRTREVPGSNLGPGDRISWLRFLWFSSVPPVECQDSTLKLGHDRFLPNSFQCIIH
jgi:hypothetical protein